MTRKQRTAIALEFQKLAEHALDEKVTGYELAARIDIASEKIEEVLKGERL